MSYITILKFKSSHISLSEKEQRSKTGFKYNSIPIILLSRSIRITNER